LNDGKVNFGKLQSGSDGSEMVGQFHCGIENVSHVGQLNDGNEKLGQSHLGKDGSENVNHVGQLSDGKLKSGQLNVGKLMLGQFQAGKEGQLKDGNDNLKAGSEKVNQAGQPIVGKDHDENSGHFTQAGTVNENEGHFKDGKLIFGKGGRDSLGRDKFCGGSR